MLASCIYLKEFEMKHEKSNVRPPFTKRKGKNEEKKNEKKMKKWKVKINRLGARGTGGSLNFTNS